MAAESGRATTPEEARRRHTAASLLAASAAAVGLGLTLAAADDPEAGAGPAPPTFRLDPNTAPPGVLASLPGLGPARVAALLAARAARPFDAPEDIERRVKGVGPATLRMLRPYLRFELTGSERTGTTTARTRSRSRSSPGP